MSSRSLRTRLTLWYVAVLAVVLILAAASVLVAQRRLGLARIDRGLDTSHAQLANMLREELRELDTPRLAAEETSAVFAVPGQELLILDQRGAVLATRLATLAAADVRLDGRPADGVWTIETGRGPWRLAVRRQTLEGVPLTVVIATPLAELARDQQELRQALALGVPAALLLACAGGLWLAAVALRPVAAMAERASSLAPAGTADLGPPARDDELGRLTAAFNGLVARLRAATRSQQQFMADASHELRSPVSVIRAAADVALSRPHRDEHEYREALAITAAQAARLGGLVADMLVLARADAGAYPVRVDDLYLDDVVEGCRQAVAVLAADRRIRVVASGATDVPIRGDEELLTRLVGNLLQNAVQHSPPGGAVTVDVQAEGPQAVVRVSDQGPGIGEADRLRIFERFVQVDPARRAGGAGLGLPIARWIAEVHQGSVTLDASGPTGSTFRIALPLAS